MKLWLNRLASIGKSYLSNFSQCGYMELGSRLPTCILGKTLCLPWASCQICACAGNAENVFPATAVNDPDMHHGTCMTHVPWCMPGSLTSGFLCSQWRGNVPSIPGAYTTRNVTYLLRGPLYKVTTNGRNQKSFNMADDSNTYATHANFVFEWQFVLGVQKLTI